MLLAVTAFGFVFWYTYYSGGIQWWYIIAPYALGNMAAIAATVAVAGALLALLGYSLSRKSGEVMKQ
jgi:hypothetical protein